MKYRFGPFELEPRERRLLRDDVELHLQPKTFDTLSFLIEKRGQLVSKDDLMEQLWPDQIVTEHSITRCIREVRKALDDNPTTGSYIETVPKAGYRFVASVEVQTREHAALRPSATDSRRIWTYASLLIFVMLAGMFTWHWFKPPTEPELNVIPVLAILPFENETSTEENELVLTGLAQDIRERLASSGRVAVTSGISVAAMGPTSSDSSGWSEALNADWLLEGSLSENQKFSTISLKLASASNIPGWQQDIQIISGDLIGISEKIAVQIASVLGFSLPPQARFLTTAASVDSINAHHQYLLARGLMAQRNPVNVDRAIQVLHEVLELMPNHANAMAALGIAYILSPDQHYPAGVALERAESLFSSALGIDPNTALAWAGRALAQAQLETDLELQGHYIDKALELNPFDADVLGWAAYLAGSEGRIDDAFDYFQRALVVDPLHTSVNGNLSFNLAKQGRYDQARAILENASIRLGNHPALYYYKVSIATNSGDLETALVLAQEAYAGWPNGVFFAAQLAGVYAKLQMRKDAEKWIAHALSLREPNEQALGARLGVAYRFGDQTTVRQTMDDLRAHPDYYDNEPKASSPWILSQLIEGHGYLGDCERLGEYMDLLFDTPQSLEGKRGTLVYVTGLAHWQAWCLLKDDRTDEARLWLNWVSEQFEFLKQRGLGNSTPHMYAESQNLALRGENTQALEIIRSMIDIGWLDQGFLAHDPRWGDLRNSPQFEEILQTVTGSTEAIRDELNEKGVVQEFEQAYREPSTHRK